MCSSDLLPFTLCVNFMMNGPTEMAQNEFEKTLVPLTYIKSKLFFFSFFCKVTILEIKGFVLTTRYIFIIDVIIFFGRPAFSFSKKSAGIFHISEVQS